MRGTRRAKRAVVVLFGVLLTASTALAAQPFGPFRTPAAPVTVDARAESTPRKSLPSADPMRFAFQVYQRTLSAQDGARCGHHPTCSLYGLQMVRRRPLLGFFFTVDRTWRGHRSSWLRPMPQTTLHGVRRYYDPPEANDFFLRGIDAHAMPELLPARPRQ